MSDDKLSRQFHLPSFCQEEFIMTCSTFIGLFLVPFRLISLFVSVIQADPNKNFENIWDYGWLYGIASWVLH